MQKEIEPLDLISFSTLSVKLTGRKDIIRKDRVGKKYKPMVKELETLLEYWISKHKL